MRAMTLALPVSAVGILAVCFTLQADVAQARGRGGFGFGIGGGIAGAISRRHDSGRRKRTFQHPPQRQKQPFPLVGR